MRRSVPTILDDDADVRETIRLFSEGCASISAVAFNDGKPLKAVELHRRVYADLKNRGLSAQIACNAIRRVAGAYASAKSNGRPAEKPFVFKRQVCLWLIGDRGRDAKVFPDRTIAIWTPAGRKHVSCRVPERRIADFDAAIEYDSLQITIDRKGKLRASISLTLSDPPVKGSIPVGVDLNETNTLVAVDSNERCLFISGKGTKVRNKRTYKTKNRLKQKLAALKARNRSTKSVGRALKRLGRKQSRRTRDLARCCAKKLCAWVPEDSVLVIEDLKIPRPTKKRFPGKSKKRAALRRKLSTFPYRALRTAIESRAARLGIAVIAVDPRNTSRRCAECGRIGVRQRHQFTCPSCGHRDHADRNAARNIRALYYASRRSGPPSTGPEASS